VEVRIGGSKTGPAAGAPSEWALLLEDYKLRVAWATAHYDRIMRRLQMFLTLETAAAAGLIVASSGEVSPAAPWIAGLATLLSVAWLHVGRADRRMIKVYVEQLKRTWKRLTELAGISASEHPAIGTMVGEAQAALGAPRLHHRLIEKREVGDIPVGSAVIPAILIVVWFIATVLFFLNDHGVLD
jgi:hypothetical protein